MIEFNHVSKTFGDQQAVSDLNLHFSEGSFSVLITPPARENRPL